MPPSLPQSSATVGGRGAVKTVTVKFPYHNISMRSLVWNEDDLQYQ
jgi:hypothetical protein